MSFLWDWMSGVMYYLGLWKKKNVLFLGAQNAGKTVLLYTVRDMPTSTYPIADELSVGGIRLNIHDIQSGHITSRKLWWKDFICGADAIVFVIDVSDRELFEESKNELDCLLSEEQISACPVLILGNKIDKQGACSEDDIMNFFGLHQQLTGKGTVPRKELQRRPLELYMCSVLKRQGYWEGLQWLSQYL